jgi:Stigma-specific protein, Stig1
MKPKHWLFFGATAISASHLSACSSKFDACSESRTCAPTNEAGAAGSEAGAAGTPENSGGDGGAAGEITNNAGASGESEAGAGGEAGATLIACDAPLSACGKACVDLKADPKNCGRCGHDCLGGECALGVCQPFTVAPGQSNPGSIVSDGLYVYWTGSDVDAKNPYVARRRVDASDAIKVIAPHEARAVGLTISPSGIEWLGDGRVRSCKAPDCDGGPNDLQPTVSDCFEILYFPLKSTLFWSCQTVYAQNNGSLWSGPIPGTTSTHVQPSSLNPTAIASDADNVYWLNASGFNSEATYNTDGSIWRWRASDGMTTALVTGLAAQLSKIAVGSGALYFTPGGVDIFRIPLPNGVLSPPKFADAREVGGMVADENALYWSDYRGGVIERCPHSSQCPMPEVIAPGQTDAGEMTQDAISIYWTAENGGDGSIRRLAK